ncbi:MAG: hypothetical protein AAB066_00170 [Candidatus Margulisiibacteriota bacterium]
MRPLSSLTLIALIVVVLRTQIQAEDFFRQNHVSLGYTGTSSGSIFHTDFFYETPVAGFGDRLYFLPQADITQTRTATSFTQNQLIQGQLSYFINTYLFVGALVEHKVISGTEDVLGAGPGIGVQLHGSYHFVLAQAFLMNNHFGWGSEFQTMLAIGIPLIENNGVECVVNWFYDQDHSNTRTIEIGSFSNHVAPVLPISVAFKSVSWGTTETQSVIAKVTSKL